MLSKLLCLLMMMFLAPGLAAAQIEQPSTAAAQAMIAKGQDTAAINTLKHAVAKKPDDYQAWFLLGVTQARKQLFEDAIASFHQVIELQPRLAEPHNNLAVIYNEKGDLRAAISELEASLELNPAYVTAHENIGDLYVKLAAESYKKALLGNDNAELARRYARLLQIRTANQPAGVTAQQVGTGLTATAKNHASPSGKTQEVLAAVEAWRTAWSRQDTGAYFAAYDERFDPGARFKTRRSWEQYKQDMIKNKKFISVELANIVVSEQTDGNMKVVMMQYFRSNSHQSDDLKELTLRPTDGGWKIIHEATL